MTFFTRLLFRLSGMAHPGLLNRIPLVARPKAPYLEWVSSCLPDGTEASEEHLPKELRVYLLPVEAAEPGELEGWLEMACPLMFESALSACCSDTTLWPVDRSLERFKEWFDLELGGEVMDVGVDPLRASEYRAT